jgi:hypothetical protein
MHVSQVLAKQRPYLVTREVIGTNLHRHRNEHDT